MILTVDIGNTNTVVGIFKGEELIESVRLESNRSKTVDEYHLLLTDSDNSICISNING